MGRPELEFIILLVSEPESNPDWENKRVTEKRGLCGLGMRRKTEQCDLDIISYKRDRNLNRSHMGIGQEGRTKASGRKWANLETFRK